MPLPCTPRAILRAALVAVLVATALFNAVVLLAMPDRVVGGWASALVPHFALRAVGLGSLVLAYLTLRRVTRVVPLLVIAGAAGLPVMIAAVQAQPIIVAGVLMTAIVTGCALLDRAWLEAVWAGRRF